MIQNTPLKEVTQRNCKTCTGFTAYDYTIAAFLRLRRQKETETTLTREEQRKAPPGRDMKSKWNVYRDQK